MYQDPNFWVKVEIILVSLLNSGYPQIIKANIGNWVFGNIGTSKYDEIEGWEDSPRQTDIKARSDSESSAIAPWEAINYNSLAILLLKFKLPSVKGSLKIPETLNIDPSSLCFKIHFPSLNNPTD